MTDAPTEFGTAEFFEQRAEEARAQAAAVPTIKPDGLNPAHYAAMTKQFDETRKTFEELAQTYAEAAQDVRDGKLVRRDTP